MSTPDQETQFTWVFRDGDDLVCHCRCADAPMGDLAQMDCPWCGCGWLFVCSKCDQAFAFGVVKAVSEDEQRRLAVQSLTHDGRKPTDEDVAEFLLYCRQLVDHPVGTRVVILDGTAIPVDHHGQVEFEGLFASHNLPWVPHVRALEDPSVLDEVLASEDYWESNALEPMDDE